MEFGVFVPQGWKGELGSYDGAAAQWLKARETALAAEAMGYDSLWLYDHLHPIPDPHSGDPVFECWTTLAAVAEATERIRLGQMVTCNGYREPALLAKMAATVDVISGGRLDLGIGAGWYWHEFDAYGYGYADNPTRLGQLRESVQIIRKLWTEDKVDFEGDHYRLHEASCDPKPLQKPRPPIWIGGGGEKVTLRIVARYGDASNFGGNPREFEHKRDVLRRHCDEIGRDFGEIAITWHPDMLVADSEAEVQRLVDARMAKWGSVTGEPEESWRAGHLVGTPEQVLEKLGIYARLGVSHVVMWTPDYPSLDTLACFAESVIPHVRAIE